jgi:tetratricopeptide (TPR) repeat protein
MIEREFDFSQDYRLLNEIGQTYVERSKLERGEERAAAREALQRRAVEYFERALAIDPEDATAHYNLALLYRQLGDAEKGERHFERYRTYKSDDNARDHAIAAHRAANPPADHAAEAIVIYDLRRDGAYELGSGSGERLAAPFEVVVPSAQIGRESLTASGATSGAGASHVAGAGGG